MGKPRAHGWSVEEVSALIDGFYAAAVDGTWADAITPLVATLGGEGASLELHERHQNRLELFEAVGLPEEGIQEYIAHYAALSERTAFMVKQPEGAVGYDYAYTDEHAISRSEFYQDFLEPWGLRYFVGGVVRNDDSYVGTLSIHRRVERGHASEREVALLRALLPHLRRAVDVHQRLGRVAQDLADQEAALESLLVGVVALDAQGRVRRTNAAARRMLGARVGLVERDGSLRALDVRQDGRLQALIRGVLAAQGGSSGGDAGGIVHIGREGEAVISVLVSRLVRSTRRSFFGWHELESRALVLLWDGSGPPLEARRTFLATRWGLTPAETELALALVSGQSRQSFALAHGKSLETVRTHLSHLRDKLGVGSEAALVRLLVRALPPLAF